MSYVDSSFIANGSVFVVGVVVFGVVINKQPPGSW